MINRFNYSKIMSPAFRGLRNFPNEKTATDFALECLKTGMSQVGTYCHLEEDCWKVATDDKDGQDLMNATELYKRGETTNFFIYTAGNTPDNPKCERFLTERQKIHS